MVNHKGQLKIFFSYIAGAGKTYAMLESAHNVKKQGIDVVIGYVEPHQRVDTIALTSGLPFVDLKTYEYQGIQVKELDLDAIIERKPQLVLIDELAHSNVPLMRHEKRYQDVEELLAAGIDVYTTINVQHFESLNDVVFSLTNVQVKERVPDRLFNEADQVKFVDIEPDDLLNRMLEGKVYHQDRIEQALRHFFKIENLNILRELALKMMVDRMHARQLDPSVDKPVHEEHILVCISSSPTNHVVIRSAARLAQAFLAPLTAVYVETPERDDFTPNHEKQLHENTRLAKQLGARIVALYGEDEAGQVAKYAQATGVTKLMVGRYQSRYPWFKTATFVDRLMTQVNQIEVYIVPTQDQIIKKRRLPIFPHLHFKEGAISLLILTIATLFGFVFQALNLMNINMITLYMLSTQIIALVTNHFIYSIFGSLFSIVLFDYFFVEPYFSLTINDPNYLSIFIGMVSISLVTSTLIHRIRRRSKQDARQAYRMNLLFQTSKTLGLSESIEAIADHSMVVLDKIFESGIIFYTYQNQQLHPHTWQLDKPGLYLTTAEQAVANWVFKNRKAAGMTTSTLPGAKAYYVPVQSKNQSLAVIGIVLKEGETISPFDASLLKSLLGEISLAIEKLNLQESAIAAENERLRNDLLRAISHDIRTPLTSIIGYAQLLNQKYEDDQLEIIQEEAGWLLQLVNNLLSLTKIENKQMVIKQQIELVDDLIHEAVKHASKQLHEQQIVVDIDDQPLLVEVDAQLIVQVLVNLITNAMKYTPGNTMIKVKAKRYQNRVQIEVIDQGQGIPVHQQQELFKQFAQSQKLNDQQRGLGLGLYLSQTIMNSHHSEIYYRNNQPNGSIFGFHLDLKEGI